MSEMTTEQISKDDSAGPGSSLPGEVLRLVRSFGTSRSRALFIVFSITARNFFTMRSILSLALQTSAITIMGIGVTFAIVTGGIDLSIGSVVALSGTVAVMAAIAGIPIWLSMIIGLLVGVVVGSLMG